MKKITKFTHWFEWARVGYYSSFYTKLFEAYNLADCGNRDALNAAFPHLFVEKVMQDKR